MWVMPQLPSFKSFKLKVGWVILHKTRLLNFSISSGFTMRLHISRPDLLSLPHLPSPLPSLVHEHERRLQLIGWNSVLWLSPSHFICFPFVWNIISALFITVLQRGRSVFWHWRHHQQRYHSYIDELQTIIKPHLSRTLTVWHSGHDGASARLQINLQFQIHDCFNGMCFAVLNSSCEWTNLCTINEKYEKNIEDFCDIYCSLFCFFTYYYSRALQ